MDEMSGLEKITEHIINKANAQAEKIINTAQQKADEIILSAKKDAEDFKNAENLKIASECEKIIQTAESENRQHTRRAMLQAKSRAISQIIEDAKKTVKNASPEEYKKILLTILKKSVSDIEGEILFSLKDKKIIDSEFIKQTEKISDGKLKISEDFCDIDGGFIIKYGKIDINCSIDAIFEDKYNELTDLVNSILSQR